METQSIELDIQAIIKDLMIKNKYSKIIKRTCGSWVGCAAGQSNGVKEEMEMY